MGKYELANIRNVLNNITDTMTKDHGEDSEEGEEEAGPVVDVDKEEVVDMDTTLGSKDKIQQEHDSENDECKGWFEMKDVWSVTDNTAE